MGKMLEHDSFIDGVFYKAGSPIPSKAIAPTQVAATEYLTADMTVDELIDFFRNGHGPKSAAAIVDRLDILGLDLVDLKSKLDTRSSSDTDAAQLIANANKQRDDAIVERDSAMQQIADLTKERETLKDQLAAATEKTVAKAK